MHIVYTWQFSYVYREVMDAYEQWRVKNLLVLELIDAWWKAVGLIHGLFDKAYAVRCCVNDRRRVKTVISVEIKAIEFTHNHHFLSLVLL